MNLSAVTAVERAIGTMREEYSTPLTVDDLARCAMYSKFHFSRMFQRVTGISPGRYLSAVRIEQAKRLLVSTTLSVADVTNQVGFSGVGSFSTRFRYSVGVTPSRYRRMDPPPFVGGCGGGCGVVRGSLAWNGAFPAFVGLFSGRVFEGVPARHVIMERPGEYVLDGVPAGSWYVLAHSMRGNLLGGTGQVQIGPESDLRVPEIRLRARRIADPPALLALLDDSAREEEPAALAC